MRFGRGGPVSAPELAALGRPGFVDGIDVSQVQGVIDWSKVAAAGFRFVVVKASEGLHYCDPRALANLAAARAAGLYALVYGFARPSQGSPAGQAAKLWDCSGDVMPARAVLDLESAPADWSPAQKVDFGEAFAEAWREYSILEPMAYTYPSFAAGTQPALGASTRLARCPLWIAQYMSTTAGWVPPVGFRPIVPKPWREWAMHQYSGNGGFRVPGIEADCDRNLFNGDEAEFRRFFGFAEPDVEMVGMPIVRAIPDWP
jgi:lysozyme